MQWFEITLEIPSQQTQRCSEILENCHAAAVSLFDAKDTPLLEPLPGATPLWDNVKVVGLFDDQADITQITNTLRESYPDNPMQVTTLPDQDWSRTWLEHFHPIQFGSRLWVCPIDYEFTAPDAEKAVILRLDPGLAFGTGTHPTTALCLRWLDAHPPIDQTVIDYGCGSGILGIAALLLGAHKVWAVDYDPQALTSTNDNAQKNQLTAAQCVTVSPEDFPTPPPQAQTVLANILANPLITLAPLLRDCCTIGGHVVLSGLLSNQVAKVIAAYQSWFEFAEVVIQEDWALLVGKRVL